MKVSICRKTLIVLLAVLTALVLVGCGGGVSGGGGGVNDDFTYTGRTVTVGGLTWMAENLNRPTKNSWCYDNDASNCEKYGRLYTWSAAMRACPVGWRLPTRQDWDNLVSAAGGRDVAGEKLKSISGCMGDTGNGVDSLGFSALPGGYRAGITYHGGGIIGHYWEAAELDTKFAYFWSIWCSHDGIMGGVGVEKGAGHSVRCVQ